MEHQSNRVQMIHHLVRALILGGFAFYIIRLVQTDALTLYIAPRMQLYVKLAAMGMYVVAAFQLYQVFRLWNGTGEADCGCEHPPASPGWRSFGIYFLFAVPLLVGFFTPDTTIGSALAGKKGMNLSAASAVKTRAEPVSGSAVAEFTDDGSGVPAASPAAPDSSDPLDALFPADKYSETYANYGKSIYGQPSIEVTEKSYMEILTTLDMFLDQFVGKKLTISGFVYRDDSIDPGKFVLGRFAIQCCTADAMPYGVMVTGGDLNTDRYANDTWLKITGTIEKTDYQGTTIMGLKLEKAEPIPASEDPYVYPDLEFGLNLPQ